MIGGNPGDVGLTPEEDPFFKKKRVASSIILLRRQVRFGQRSVHCIYQYGDCRWFEEELD